MAASIFVIACATDPLDGYFARSRSEVSTLGIFLDPLADKLLVMSAFVILVKYQVVAAWMVIIIIAREVSITGLRAIVSPSSRESPLPQDTWGKIKDRHPDGGRNDSALHDSLPGDYSRHVSLLATACGQHHHDHYSGGPPCGPAGNIFKGIGTDLKKD